jgi:hypothetical protein
MEAKATAIIMSITIFAASSSSQCREVLVQTEITSSTGKEIENVTLAKFEVLTMAKSMDPVVS